MAQSYYAILVLRAKIFSKTPDSHNSRSSKALNPKELRNKDDIFYQLFGVEPEICTKNEVFMD
jgi:hypothetical protein